MEVRFSARIYKSGINPCVDVPEEVSRTIGNKGYLAVRGTVQGFAFRTNLVPVRGRPYRLFINGSMRQGAGVVTGDTVEVGLEPDRESRSISVPRELTEALGGNPAAAAAWEGLTSSRRKDVLNYLNSLKTGVSLRRNIDRLMRQLVS
jgi:hypothetical protein